MGLKNNVVYDTKIKILIFNKVYYEVSINKISATNHL